MNIYKLSSRTAYPAVPDTTNHKTSRYTILWNDNRYDFSIWKKIGNNLYEIDMGFVVKRHPTVGVYINEDNDLREIPSYEKKHHINKCADGILVTNLHDLASMVQQKPDGFYAYVAHKWSEIGVAACRIIDMSSDLNETLTFIASHSQYEDCAEATTTAKINTVQAEFDLATILQGSPCDVGPDEYPARLIADAVSVDDVDFFCNYVTLTFQRLIPFGELELYRSLAYDYWCRAHASSDEADTEDEDWVE